MGRVHLVRSLISFQRQREFFSSRNRRTITTSRRPALLSSVHSKAHRAHQNLSVRVSQQGLVEELTNSQHFFTSTVHFTAAPTLALRRNGTSTPPADKRQTRRTGPGNKAGVYNKVRRGRTPDG
eukprot:539269-Prorocentrum_minimum.AAC.4